MRYALLPRHLRRFKTVFDNSLFDEVHTLIGQFYQPDQFDQLEAYHQDGSLIDCHELETSLGPSNMSLLIEALAFEGIAA